MTTLAHAAINMRIRKHFRIYEECGILVIFIASELREKSLFLQFSHILFIVLETKPQQLFGTQNLSIQIRE